MIKILQRLHLFPGLQVIIEYSVRGRLKQIENRSLIKKIGWLPEVV